MFRQCSNFAYFTGFLEPESLLMLESGDAKQQRAPRSTLFVPQRDVQRELWDGARTGSGARCVEFLGVDEALDVGARTTKRIGAALAKASKLYVDLPNHVPGALQDILSDSVEQRNSGAAGVSQLPVHGLTALVESMRLVKSPSELAVMERAGNIAAAGFTDAMRAARAGDLECVLSSQLDVAIRRRGAARLPFPPVVANGRNGRTIHYISNDHLLRSGDLVLFDGGCEYGGYVSDITRTFPVDAKFSEPQAEVYDRVLDCNQKCIDVCVTVPLVSTF